MTFDDGLNVPESRETLLLQQRRLVEGMRAVQMFPVGTAELPIPDGMLSVKNSRGVFHYDPRCITDTKILALSRDGRENEFLELGPYSKSDVIGRIMAGEKLITVMECTPDKIEVRSAAGCQSLLKEQVGYFERTKEPDNQIVCVKAPPRVIKELENG